MQSFYNIFTNMHLTTQDVIGELVYHYETEYATYEISYQTL